MKIVRHFVNARSDDTDIEGYLPLWVPGSSTFDPGTPRLMVHDMLEHRLCDKGLFHEELMAFGRVIALRIIPQVGTLRDRPSIGGLGSELGDVWFREQESGNSLRIAHAPKTEPLSEPSAEETVQAVATEAMKSAWRQITYDTPESWEVRPTARLHAAFVGWMRVGYRDALRRYGPQDHGCYEVGHAAFEWASSRQIEREFAAQESPDNGTVVVRLEFDTEALCMRHRFYEERESGFPEWIRNKLHWHRTSRTPQVQGPAFLDA